MVIDEIRRDKLVARPKSVVDVYTWLCMFFLPVPLPPLIDLVPFSDCLSALSGVRFSWIRARDTSQFYAYIRGGTT